jgi:rubrerythrin
MPENTEDETTNDPVRSITETARDHLSSRRTFLAGTAAVGGASLVGSTGTVLADSHEEESKSGDKGSEKGDNGKSGRSDLDILNYALTLEHLEAEFYAKGLEDFSDAELIEADVLCDRFCRDVREKLPDYVRTVGEHEAIHVEQLTAVINDLGGDPVEAAEYDFGYENASQFYATAAALENTGVAAYAGAAPAIKNDDILAAALSIHSVEARHAGTVNLFNGDSPFPAAFDQPKGMEEVVEIASQFIVSD